MNFELLASAGAARRGRLELPHGTVDTPAFMPVGTYGAVKAMTPREVAASGAQILLGNTFHLWLRPGLEVIAAHGGLHRFIAAELQRDPVLNRQPCLLARVLDSVNHFAREAAAQ